MKKAILFFALALTLGSTQEQTLYPASFYHNPLVEKLFKDVKFNDPGVRIDFIPIVECNGDLTVHFGSVDQLMATINCVLGTRCSGDVYYSYEPVRTQIHYSASEGGVFNNHTIYIDGPVGLKLYGYLPYDIDLPIFFSNSFDIGNLKYKKFACDLERSIVARLEILFMLKESGVQENIQRTTRDILEKDRILEEEENYPSLLSGVVDDELLYCSDKPVDIKKVKVLKSEQAVVVVAKSKTELKTQLNERRFSNLIRFLMPASDSGFYSRSPIRVVDRLLMSTQGSLLLSGFYEQQNSGMEIKPNGLCLFINLQLILGDSVIWHCAADNPPMHYRLEESVEDEFKGKLPLNVYIYLVRLKQKFGFLTQHKADVLVRLAQI